MTDVETHRLRRTLRRNVPALLAAAGLAVLTYQIVLNFRYGKSDFIDHIQWAEELNGPAILAAFRGAQERLWHMCVYLLLRLGIDDPWRAAALVTAAADGSACFLVCRCWDRILPEKQSRFLLAGLMACAFLAGSLTLPGGSFYRGRAAVNTWHNPTNVMVRPFAAAVFYMTVDIYDRRRNGEARFSFSGGLWQELRRPVFTPWQVVLYPLCVLLSAYAKPSFLQFFAPAVFLFLLADVLRTKGKLLPFAVKMALPYLPAALILLLQVFHFFGGSVSLGTASAPAGQSGVAVYFIQPRYSGWEEFFQVLGDNLPMFLCPCAFPLAVLLAGSRRNGASVRLGWACLAVGLLEMLFLHETGERAAHGNFSWGYYLSVWLLWTASVGAYTGLLREKGAGGALARWVGTPLLAWHVACGVEYIGRILLTADYYF